MEMRELFRELMGDRSQTEFAEELGITQAAVSAILLGKRSVGARVTRQLILAFPDREREIQAAFFASEYASGGANTTQVVTEPEPEREAEEDA